MLGTEIKEKIDFNNKEIERILTPNIWTLNNAISELLEENKSLQEACPHEYKEGFCVYCYKQE